jgi:shikimate kinase
MKVMLFGCSGVGKSTVAASLGQPLGLRVLEADDEATRLNGGVWPAQEETIDHFFELTNIRVLELEEVLYVTSWLEPEEIAAFHQQGFVIIELYANLAALIARKQRRGDTIDEQRFLVNYRRSQEIIDSAQVQRMLSLSIDTSHLPPAKVKQTVATFLGTIGG